MKNPQTGLLRLVSAAKYSQQGFVSAYKNEAAFRQEVWAAIVLIPAAAVLADSLLEAAAMISAVFFVLIVELLNSAVEAVVDRVGEEFHELAGRAKDMGSAAVLLSIFILVVVWAAALLN